MGTITRTFEDFEIVDVSSYGYTKSIAIGITNPEEGSGWVSVELTIDEAKRLRKLLKEAIAEVSA